MKIFFRKAFIFNLNRLFIFMFPWLVSIQSFAQDVAQSDLSNPPEISSVWYAQSWFWALIIALLILFIGILVNQRHNRDLDRIENRFKKMK